MASTTTLRSRQPGFQRRIPARLEGLPSDVPVYLSSGVVFELSCRVRKSRWRKAKESVLTEFLLDFQIAPSGSREPAGKQGPAKRTPEIAFRAVPRSKLHAKCSIVDGTRAIIGSMNLRTESLDRGDCRITDLGSGNGTFVNGDRLNGTAPLHPGDVFRIADSEEFHLLDL